MITYDVETSMSLFNFYSTLDTNFQSGIDLLTGNEALFKDFQYMYELDARDFSFSGNPIGTGVAVLEFSTNGDVANAVRFRCYNTQTEFSMKLYTKPTSTAQWNKVGEFTVFELPSEHEAEKIFGFELTSNKYFRIEFIFATSVTQSTYLGGFLIALNNSVGTTTINTIDPSMNSWHYNTSTDKKFLNSFFNEQLSSDDFYTRNYGVGTIQREMKSQLVFNSPKIISTIDIGRCFLSRGIGCVGVTWVESLVIYHGNSTTTLTNNGSCDSSGLNAIFSPTIVSPIENVNAIEYTLSFESVISNGINSHWDIIISPINIYETLYNFIDVSRGSSVTYTIPDTLTYAGDMSLITSKENADTYISAAGEYEYGAAEFIIPINDTRVDFVDIFFMLWGDGSGSGVEEFPTQLKLYYKPTGVGTQYSEFKVVDFTGGRISGQASLAVPVLRIATNYYDTLSSIKIVFNITNENAGFGEFSINNLSVACLQKVIQEDYLLPELKIKDYGLVGSDNSSLKLYNGVETVGIKLVDVDSTSASPVRIYTGSEIKALAKVI